MQFSSAQVVLSIITVALTMLMMVGIVVFILIRNYRLRIEQEKGRAQMIQSIQESERETIFRNLHDDVGPHLSAVKLKIESLSKSTDPVRFQNEIELAQQSVEQSLLVVKSIIRNLRPVDLLKDGINKALDQLKDFVETNSKIKVELFIEGFSIPPNEEIMLQLFRAILEMMNNSMQHSQAKKITVILSKTKEEIHLQYQDDGIGFDTNKISSGMGLKNIKHRFQLINGTFHFISSPGNGVIYKSVILLQE